MTGRDRERFAYDIESLNKACRNEDHSLRFARNPAERKIAINNLVELQSELNKLIKRYTLKRRSRR